MKNTRSRRISNSIASSSNDVTSDLRTRLNMQIFRNQVPLWPPVGVVLDYALVNGQLACFPEAGIPKDFLCLFQSFHWPVSPSGKGRGYLWAQITNFKRKLVKHRSSIRAVFKWRSKVLIRLRLLRLVIGFIIMRRFFNQWEAKRKPHVVWAIFPALALRKLQMIAGNLDWFIALFASVAIGRSHYFGIGFSTVIWKPL